MGGFPHAVAAFLASVAEAGLGGRSPGVGSAHTFPIPSVDPEGSRPEPITATQ